MGSPRSVLTAVKERLLLAVRHQRLLVRANEPPRAGEVGDGCRARQSLAREALARGSHGRAQRVRAPAAVPRGY